MEWTDFVEEFRRFVEEYEVHGADQVSLSYSKGYHDALVYVLEWMEEYV